MKQDVQKEGVCKWRIQSEGMPILEGYVGEERVVNLYKKETLRKLLIEMFPKLSEGAWEDLDEIGERVRDIGMGCCVLRIHPTPSKSSSEDSGEEKEEGFKERMVLPLWRSLHSLNLMLAKEDRTAMLLRIYNDTTPLVNNHHPGQKKTDPSTPADVEAPMTGSIEGANSAIADAEALESANQGAVGVKEGPYGEIVQGLDESNAAKKGLDVRAEKISKGIETGGSEEQLDGMGGIEGQLGGVA